MFSQQVRRRIWPRTVAGEFLPVSARAANAKILSVCITYYAGGLERKRSVYERAIDPVLFPATIMAFVEKGGENHTMVFAGIPTIYAMFNDFRHYKIYSYDKNIFARGARKYDNRAINFSFLRNSLRELRNEWLKPIINTFS